MPSLLRSCAFSPLPFVAVATAAPIIGQTVTGDTTICVSGVTVCSP
jgi:hypothetical protein